MRKTATVILIASVVFALPADAVTIDPIPGSLIYPTQPKTKLKKAPVGSLLQHEFHSNGSDYRETYRVEPNRDLKLLERRQSRKK